jgi:hypothetical protein
MINFRWLASFVLAANMVPALTAETHCPGNVESVPFRLVNRYQMIVPVSINRSGPYNFLLDTGTEITTVSPSLAAELALNSQGAAVVAGVGFRGSASFAQLDLLETGSHSVANQKVLLYDSASLRSGHPLIRGILGEDFLAHFDVLIDYAHSLLCIDDSDTMDAAVKGSHITLLTPALMVDGTHPGNAAVIEVKLSDGSRPIHLQLDSGTNVSFHFNTSRYMPMGFLRSTSMFGSGLDGAQRPFSTMPPQDLEIGRLKISRVSFFTLAGAQKDSTESDFDGMLPTSLFRRVFICHTHHIAVFEPW